MNKDVLFTIYEIVHRDLTKHLNAEYLQRLTRCACDKTICYNVCNINITIKYDDIIYMKAYNFRVLDFEWSNVYTKYGRRRCNISANYLVK